MRAWTPSRAAWVQRRTRATCSVSNRWGSHFAHGRSSSTRTRLQLRLGEPGAGLTRLVQSVRERLANDTGKAGTVEGADGLIDAHAGREETTHRVEPRSAGCTGIQARNDLGRTAGEQLGRPVGIDSRVVEQVERPSLIHGSGAAGHRQVGKTPQMALVRRRDHVGGVPRTGSGGNGIRLAVRDRRRSTAERVENLPVLFERRRVDELKPSRRLCTATASCA